MTAAEIREYVDTHIERGAWPGVEKGSQIWCERMDVLVGLRLLSEIAAQLADLRQSIEGHQFMVADEIANVRKAIDRFPAQGT